MPLRSGVRYEEKPGYQFGQISIGADRTRRLVRLAGHPTARQARHRLGAHYQTQRKQLADGVQKVTLSEVPYVPFGEWVQPTAFRKNFRDVIKFGAPISGT
jgi:hypothetical protein